MLNGSLQKTRNLNLSQTSLPGDLLTGPRVPYVDLIRSADRETRSSSPITLDYGVPTQHDVATSVAAAASNNGRIRTS